MGFFSALIGTSSEWDGASYVAKLAGNKFWHSNFINKDAMRQAGVDFAFESSPLDAAIKISQSPMTIPGELMYLLKVCESQGDKNGARWAARAMSDLLQKHSSKIWDFTEMKFSTTAYEDYLMPIPSGHQAIKNLSHRTKAEIFDEVKALIRLHVEGENIKHFLGGYIVLDDKYALDDFISVSFCDEPDLDTNIYSLVRVSSLAGASGIQDALVMKMPKMLEEAINLMASHVIEYFERDSIEYRDLRESK